MGKKIIWQECPMYSASHMNIQHIENIVKNQERLLELIKEAITEQKALRVDQMEQSKTLDSHMTEREKERDSTNTALLAMGKSIEDLQVDKKERDVRKDKREALRDKIYASLALAVAIGAYNLFMDLMHMKQIIVGD